MSSLQNLVNLRENLVQDWFNFDFEFEKIEDYDVNTLYLAYLMSKVMILYANMVERKVGNLKIQYSDKVDLDIFLTDIRILMGQNFTDIKDKLIRDMGKSPFSEISILYEDKVKYRNDNDSIHLRHKINSLHLEGRGTIIQPVEYEDYLHKEFNFCSEHLWFHPQTEIYLDGNIAQTNYVNAVRAMLNYFMKENIPFALFSDNFQIDTEKTYIIGGVNRDRGYRINPNHSSDLEERVWLNIMNQMLPEYSKE